MESDAPEVANTTAQLRVTHLQESGWLQRVFHHICAFIARPQFVALVSVGIIGWVAGNLAVARLGLPVIDPPPFHWLQGAASVGALLLAALILTTQRREDALADHRSQLILELAITNDQKIAKIIALHEEGRRDNPSITDRVDHLAAAMSVASDTDAVLVAIKDLRDDVD